MRAVLIVLTVSVVTSLVKGQTTGFDGKCATNIDYEYVQSLARTAAAEALSEVRSRLCSLEAKLFDLLSAPANHCSSDGGFPFEGRCYTPIIHDSRTITYNEAKSLCENAAQKLADITSLRQQLAIQGFVRGKRLNHETTYLYLAMTFRYQGRRLTSSTGQLIHGLHWYPEYPKDTDGHTKMMLDVIQAEDSEYQGVWNDQPAYRTDGALCERLL